MIKDLKRDLHDLKESEIAGLLYILLNMESLENASLARLTGLPKEVLKQFKLRISGILKELPGEELVLTDEGKRILSDLKLRPYHWSLLSYKDEQIENQLQEIRKKYKLEPKREFDQFFAETQTSVAKAKIIAEKGMAEGKRILLIGDDDLVSIALGLMNLNYVEVTVLDIDREMLDTIEKIAQDYKLDNIKTRQFDVRNAIPGNLLRAFDVVMTDPPYTKSGIELFLNRSIQMLGEHENYEGRYIFLFFGNSFKSPEKFLKIQEVINKYDIVIEDKIDKFARYHGAESIGSASSLYILKTTPFTKLYKDLILEKSIYTFENQKEEKFPYVDHVVLKLFDVPTDIIESKTELLKILGEFCRKHSLKVVDSKVTKFKKGGISITFILSNSNLLVHTWPEYNAIHIDLITCLPIHNKDGIPLTASQLFKTGKLEFRVLE